MRPFYGAALARQSVHSDSWHGSVRGCRVPARGTSVLHLAMRAGASAAQAGVSLQDRMRRQHRRVAQPIP
ncbi:protein of unknown function [Cupriavidus taiwanensis]|nr:protein of unknown function [Cupriavidus taiwanensis]